MTDDARPFFETLRGMPAFNVAAFAHNVALELGGTLRPHDDRYTSGDEFYCARLDFAEGYTLAFNNADNLMGGRLWASMYLMGDTRLLPNQKVPTRIGFDATRDFKRVMADIRRRLFDDGAELLKAERARLDGIKAELAEYRRTTADLAARLPNASFRFAHEGLEAEASVKVSMDNGYMSARLNHSGHLYIAHASIPAHLVEPMLALLSGDK